MSSHYRHPRAARGRANLYDEITDKIIADLETGRLPWVQPWGSGAAKAPLSLPRNASTGRDYSGINVLILWGAVVEQGYTAQLWLTFRQALTLGGNVRKGERGTTVVYADRFVPDYERKRASDAGEDARTLCRLGLHQFQPGYPRAAVEAGPGACRAGAQGPEAARDTVGEARHRRPREALARRRGSGARFPAGFP